MCEDEERGVRCADRDLLVGVQRHLVRGTVARFPVQAAELGRERCLRDLGRLVAAPAATHRGAEPGHELVILRPGVVRNGRRQHAGRARVDRVAALLKLGAAGRGEAWLDEFSLVLQGADQVGERVDGPDHLEHHAAAAAAHVSLVLRCPRERSVVAAAAADPARPEAERQRLVRVRLALARGAVLRGRPAGERRHAQRGGGSPHAAAHGNTCTLIEQSSRGGRWLAGAPGARAGAPRRTLDQGNGSPREDQEVRAP